MANILISDIFSSEADSLLAGIDDKEGDLIKSAVNRALEVRGGLASPVLEPLPIKYLPILIGIIFRPLEPLL